LFGSSQGQREILNIALVADILKKRDKCDLAIRRHSPPQCAGTRKRHDSGHDTFVLALPLIQWSL
jgi:hypothetical protein